MIDSIKILNEINRILINKYPEYAVYINHIPKDFERPSFFIEFIRNNQALENKITLKEENYFTITVFSEIDEYNKTDKINLQQLLIDILKLFQKGFIKVEDRAVKLKSSSGGISDYETYIDIQTEHYESIEETEEEKLIENIEIKEGK